MRAAVLRARNQVEVQDLPPPQPSGVDEVLTRVLYAGVCKTDNHLTSTGASVGLVLGHEVVCEVPGEASDTRFVLNNEVSCGRCSYCQEGLTSHCTDLAELGVNRHGGYAEQMAVPQRNLYALRLRSWAVGVLAEPMSCAVRGAERVLSAARLLPGERTETLIIGGGVSGRLMAYLLRRKGHEGRMWLYDTSPSLPSWPQSLGVERLQAVRPESAHMVLECSGSAGGLETAFTAVRRAGVVCLYGVPPDGVALPVLAGDLFKRELTVITSFAGCTDRTMAEAIACLESDEDFFQALLGRFIQLEDLGGELTRWAPQPGTRTVVDVTGEKGGRR